MLPADPAAPSVLRDRMRAWLDQHGWPAEGSADLVLAVNEAVSNAVDHAYPDDDATATVDVQLRVVAAEGHRWIEAVVRDHGRWQPPPATRTSGGHGLPVMRACTAALRIDTGPDGTRVYLSSHPVPARAW